MKLSSCTLSRYLRLSLLLLMLAAQGVVNAHELGDSHALQSDPCTTCLVGHGLGAAVSVNFEAPQVQIGHLVIPTYSIPDVSVSRTQTHFARAPPGTLCNIQNPI
jgi:hypothetical protein